MKCLLFSLLIIFCVQDMDAQIYLKPSIGVSTLPLDMDTICTIPNYTGSFYTSGLANNDTAYDFTLFDRNNNAITLSQLCATGKPTLIVNGSYTCPVFRGKIPQINQVLATYGNAINVLIVYTVEAHPTNISPYFGFVNTGAANINAGILYAQPQTYLERKNIVDSLLSQYALNATVYLDAPCQNWWNTYGPAPNNAYIINPNGIVYKKHGWFDKYPDNIFCDLDTLLNVNSGKCNSINNTGTFSLQMISNDTVLGTAGSTIYASLDLINNSSQSVLVKVAKLAENYDIDWESSFCTDVCYPISVDTTILQIPANTTLPFHLYLYTNSSVAGISSVRLGFKNENNNNNSYSQWITGISHLSPTTISTELNSSISNVSPNPCLNSFTTQFFKSQNTIEIFDLFGRRFTALVSNNRVDCSEWVSGVYYFKIEDHVFKILKE